MLVLLTSCFTSLTGTGMTITVLACCAVWLLWLIGTGTRVMVTFEGAAGEELCCRGAAGVELGA